MADTVDDAHRWDQAFAVLADGRTAAARAALRPAQRRAGALVVATVGVAAAVGVLVAAVLISHAPRASDPSRARQVVGFGLTLLGLGVLIAFLVPRVRRGRLTQAWRAPALVLRRAQRRSLVRQVLGRQPVDPELLPLTRDVAARIVRGQPLPLLAGLVIQQAGQALTVDSRGYTAWFAGLVVLYVVAGAWSAWQVLRASRFLRAHAA